MISILVANPWILINYSLIRISKIISLISNRYFMTTWIVITVSSLNNILITVFTCWVLNYLQINIRMTMVLLNYLKTQLKRKKELKWVLQHLEKEKDNVSIPVTPIKAKKYTIVITAPKLFYKILLTRIC